MSLPPSLKTPELVELYKKDEKLKREEINLILEWTNEDQSHLPNITEFQAILFLQSCYYSVEDAKKSIENYFTSRTQNPFMFECPSEELLRDTLSYSFINVMPDRDPDGHMLLYFQLLDSNMEKYISSEQLRLTDMVIMLNLFQYGPATGMKLVFDASNSTLMHVLKIHWGGVRKLLFHVQEAIPVRIKEIHFININSVMDKFIGLIRPLMKKELAKMLVFHRDSPDTLQQYIPPELLPEEWGGCYNTIPALHEYNVNNLVNNLEFFKWQDSQQVDESKRAIKVKGFFGYFWK